MGYQWSNVFKYGVSSSVNWLNIVHFGEFFGVACFSIEGIGLILPIKASMQNHQGFRQLFHVSAFLIVIWYVMFGASGALSLGKQAKGIIFFIYGKTFSLIYPLAVSYAVVILLLNQAIFLSFPMLLFPVSDSACKARWYRGALESIGCHKDEHATTATRLLLVILCFAVSLSGINIIDLINLSGSLLNSFTAFIFPVDGC